MFKLIAKASSKCMLGFNFFFWFEILILIKRINTKRLAQRFDIVEMSLSSERINYKPHISTKIEMFLEQV